MAYEDGTIEMSTSGTNDIILPPYGKVIGFATRHTEIDPNTKVGTTTFITNFTAGGKVTQQVDSGVVEVIDCPKITPLDRENLRNLKKFIRSITVIRRQSSKNCGFDWVPKFWAHRLNPRVPWFKRATPLASLMHGI